MSSEESEIRTRQTLNGFLVERRAGECEWFGLAPPKVSLWALVVLRPS